MPRSWPLPTSLGAGGSPPHCAPVTQHPRALPTQLMLAHGQVAPPQQVIRYGFGLSDGVLKADHQDSSSIVTVTLE
jgi:hypothetical protein